MVRFAHISDIHLSPLPEIHPVQLMSKRMIGYLSWQHKRRFIQQPAVLQALLEDLTIQKPDYICITGDMVNISLPAEFSAAALWLKRLQEISEVMLVPGNHDAYVTFGQSAIAQHWMQWVQGDEEYAHTQLFPFVRVREEVAFIGLSSALATPPFFATGTLGEHQLYQLQELLQKVTEASLFPIILLHHPPKSGVTSLRKALTDAKKLEAILSSFPRSMLLHGHLHRPLHYHVNNRTPVWCAGSASSSGARGTHPAHYHLFGIDHRNDKTQIEVTHHHYLPENRQFHSKDTMRLSV